MSFDASNTPVYLIGFADALATPEVCFSLRTTGARIVCFCRPWTRWKFARLNFVQYFEVTAPEDDFNRTIAEVQSLIGRLEPDLILPCDDVALLVVSRLKEDAGRCLSPAAEICQFAIDKWAQIDAARESGFAVMTSRLLTDETDIAGFPIRPAILKPRAAIGIHRAGIGKGRTFLVEGRNLNGEAQNALAREQYLIQEYKMGVGEGLFGIAHRGEVVTSFGHRRLRMMNPAGSGASACISRKPDAEEIAAAQTLIRRVAWRGPFMIELLRDPSGKAWFMEFNGRFWGSLALARRCGFDVPRLAADLALGRDPQLPLAIGAGFARHLGRDLMHLLFVLRGPRESVYAVSWPRPFTTLKAVLRPHSLKSFYNYDPLQPFFFLKDAALTVTNGILRRMT